MILSSIVLFALICEGKEVVRLEYEEYTAMAIKQLKQICVDVREKWPVCKLAIVHRIG